MTGSTSRWWGAIDLVMHVNLDFKQAVAWLNDVEKERHLKLSLIQIKLLFKLNSYAHSFLNWDEDKWQQAYLTRERRLPSSLVDNLHDSG